MSGSPLKATPPPIDFTCTLVAKILHEGKPLVDAEGGEVLVDLSGGAGAIEWTPAFRIMSFWDVSLVEQGLDSYSLRVWKRRHGVLWVGHDSANESESYAEPAFTDPWATWLDLHMDLRFLMAGVEFQIVQAEGYRNGVNYWLMGRKVSA